jgi:hypothetical protein
MPATYEPIATTTLGSAASTITFSSIPGTYTDLKLVILPIYSTAGRSILWQVNNDTGSNYSFTSVYGDGGSTGSYRVSNSTYWFPFQTVLSSSTTIPNLHILDIFSYAGSTNKTALEEISGDLNSTGGVLRSVNLWRSTAAITSIKATASASATFSTGTTATLYGILKA